MTTAVSLEEVKNRQQKTWSSGDYGKIAWITVPLADVLCEAADLPGARSAYQPVITLTPQDPKLPQQHDMSCSLSSTRLPVRIIPQPAGALTAGEHPQRRAAEEDVAMAACAASVTGWRSAGHLARTVVRTPGERWRS